VKNYHRKGIDRAIFAADLIANAFEGVSFSDAKCMGGDYLKVPSVKIEVKISQK